MSAANKFLPPNKLITNIRQAIERCKQSPDTYEARTLLGLGVSLCRARVGVRHDTYDYTKLCHFLKLLSVSMSMSCLMYVFVLHSQTLTTSTRCA